MHCSLTKLIRDAVATLVLLATCGAFGADGAARTQRLCDRGSAAVATDPRVGTLVASAHEQHRLFGGQVIDRAGRVIHLDHGQLVGGAA